MTIELAKALVEREKDGQEISLSAQQVANVLRPQKAKKTANTPEQKTRGFKLEIELFADFLPESITKKEAIERITEALRQFNEYSGAVSYTHLDVYKRQGRTYAPTASGAASRP